MATLTGSAANTELSYELGPLLDDGAPFSAIEQVELSLPADHIGLSPNPKIDAIPQALGSHAHWQYGTGEPASPARRILGSIVLTATSDHGTPVRITHLVLEGSSQWVIGRNVTRKANIEHIGRNALVFYGDGECEYISIINYNFLSYLSIDSFKSSYNNCNHVAVSDTRLLSRNRSLTLSSISAVAIDTPPWSDVKRIIDKVHKHVCGHASFTDYKLLLERNRLWNDVIASYLTQVVNACTACRSTFVPEPSRKVSIISLSK